MSLSPKTKRPLLIIVPGIGDRTKAYELFAWVWRRLGYDVHIIAFGWGEYKAPLVPKLQTFLKALDELQARDMYIIGVSAGGPAAVNALAERDYVRKVITVCSPFDTFPSLRNPLLAESIRAARAYLAKSSPAQRLRLLSVHALYDPVVAIKLSQPREIKTIRVWALLHPVAIFVALTFYSRRLRNFLRKPV